ncbi:uncharacterized protein [Palaemon carinicauda]|uniref:uncharacterized protein isoform X1 n=1 Tax=Palaemon carinicauda TaxID=392227 RepID=UPI0035B629D8
MTLPSSPIETQWDEEKIESLFTWSLVSGRQLALMGTPATCIAIAGEFFFVQFFVCRATELQLYIHRVEELNIRSMLGHIQDVELKSRTTTPLESSVVQGENVKELVEKYSSAKTGIAMDETQINLRTLDLDSTPLIQRMLRDSQVYEEDEEEVREEEAFDVN